MRLSRSEIGVDDLLRNDDRRVLSAVRNVHAGVLLLCKEKLRRLSPLDEILLAQRFEPQPDHKGEVSIREGSAETTRLVSTTSRSVSKSFHVALDWKRFDAVADIRNHMEHSYFKGTRERARQAVADAFLVIRQLLVEALREVPLKALGPECWNALLENADLFETELKSCQVTLENVEWETEAAARALPDFICPSCRSSLVRQRNSDNHRAAECRADLRCVQQRFRTWTGAELHIDETFGAEGHIAVKDGGEPPISTCPKSSKATYVVAEEGRCAACDFTLPEDAACAIYGHISHKYALRLGHGLPPCCVPINHLTARSLPRPHTSPRCIRGTSEIGGSRRLSRRYGPRPRMSRQRQAQRRSKF